MDDSPYLDPADRALLLPAITEYVVSLTVRKIKLQGGDSVLADGDLLVFPGLFLGQHHVASESPASKVVHILLSELQ